MSYYYYPNAIDEHDCNDLIKEFNHQNQIQADTYKSHNSGSYYSPPLEGEDDKPKDRETKINWLKSNHPMNKIILDYIKDANNTVWRYALTKMTPCQFAKYEVGGFYEWHQDTAPGLHEHRGELRKLSVTLQLSNHDDYEGGELQFWRGNRNHIIPPIKAQGSIIVFDSHVWHQVTPVTKGVRYSIVSWILGPPFV